MTVVYGVTRVGGRLQIAVSSILISSLRPGDHTHHTHTHTQKQLHGTIPDKELFSCANYVVGCVFESLREMFTNARQIQVCWHTDKHKGGISPSLEALINKYGTVSSKITLVILFHVLAP